MSCHVYALGAKFGMWTQPTASYLYLYFTYTHICISHICTCISHIFIFVFHIFELVFHIFVLVFHTFLFVYHIFMFVVRISHISIWISVSHICVWPVRIDLQCSSSQPLLPRSHLYGRQPSRTMDIGQKEYNPPKIWTVHMRSDMIFFQILVCTGWYCISRG